MEMKIEFKDNKEIITHPSGVVSEYTKEQLEAHRKRLVDEKIRLDESIKRLDEDIFKLKEEK